MSHDPEFLPHEHEHADSWHRHTTAEGEPQVEHTAHVNPTAIFGALCVSTVFTIIVVIVTAFYFLQHTSALKKELRETTNSAAQQIEYRAAAMAMQEQYAWENAQEGTVRIPITQAMQSVVEEYQQQEALRDDG